MNNKAFNDQFDHIFKGAASGGIPQKSCGCPQPDVSNTLSAQGFTAIECKEFRICAIRRTHPHYAIFVDIKNNTFSHYYTYETELDAKVAFHNWDGNGDPLHFTERYDS